MYHSDLELLIFSKERERDLLAFAEKRRRIRDCRKHGSRPKLAVWAGTQLIVLGERMKGGGK